MNRTKPLHHTTVYLLIVGMIASLFQQPMTAAAAAPAASTATTTKTATAAVTKAGLPYDDIRSNYATEAIVNMTKLNFITGTGERRFEPDKAITRAEFVTLIDRLLGMEPVSGAIPAFADVLPAAWFYNWVETAIQLNLVQGTSPALFEPQRPVSREEAAVILARAWKQPLIPSSSVQDGLYSDQKQIDTWALPSVERLSRIRLMTGDQDGFRPLDSITRQEAAVLMNRAWTHAGWKDKLLASPSAAIQLGWQYGQTTKQFEQQVSQSVVNTVSPRWFFLGSSGGLEDQTDLSLLTWAHKQNKKVWAMVGNHASQETTHAMLSDSNQQRSFIQQLANRVRSSGIDGLNIDFENMMPEDRNAFTSFITALHQALNTVPAVLTVNVSPDFGTDWTDVFDYAALSANADYIVLMGYDEHWGGDPVPGSVSSLPWLRLGIDQILKKAPASKVILAMPLYTRDWTLGANGAYTSQGIDLLGQNRIVQAKKSVTKWDDTLGQYTSEYVDQLLLHRIWLEDGRSLTRKANLANAYSLAGCAYWYMGGESSDVWSSLRNANKFNHYDFS
ncbi:glycoside hydrolase [Paenibacillus rhizovicinus]|uniref:Glycoside hydrolase n=1 Tax=Paenibacillus rhizovicinus TaxID=2704463 RepID=A0A6C0P8B2_9BACL|nr:glycosyl hydrolase family 18 protein [Paenibacillus rhizovicinus]QHW34794.1 glycoside hydrolase [Paenibacillus rhizovicinus]